MNQEQPELQNGGDPSFITMLDRALECCRIAHKQIAPDTNENAEGAYQPGTEAYHIIVRNPRAVELNLVAAITTLKDLKDFYSAPPRPEFEERFLDDPHHIDMEGQARGALDTIRRKFTI